MTPALLIDWWFYGTHYRTGHARRAHIYKVFRDDNKYGIDTFFIVLIYAQNLKRKMCNVCCIIQSYRLYQYWESTHSLLFCQMCNPVQLLSVCTTITHYFSSEYMYCFSKINCWHTHTQPPVYRQHYVPSEHWHFYTLNLCISQQNVPCVSKIPKYINSLFKLY